MMSGEKRIEFMGYEWEKVSGKWLVKIGDLFYDIKWNDSENLISKLNEQQSIINKLQEEKIELLKKVFLFEKGIAVYLQKEEQMGLYNYVDLEMKR